MVNAKIILSAKFMICDGHWKYKFRKTYKTALFHYHQLKLAASEFRKSRFSANIAKIKWPPKISVLQSIKSKRMLNDICPLMFLLNFKFLMKNKYILGVIMAYGKITFVCLIYDLWLSLEIGEFRKTYKSAGTRIAIRAKTEDWIRLAIKCNQGTVISWISLFTIDAQTVIG